MKLPPIFFRFYHEKIIQILAYLQKKVETKDKLKLIKLLFFADRQYLREYVSPMSFDIYFALRNGPVASRTLNMLNLYEDYIDSQILDAIKNKIILTKNKTERIILEDKTDYISEAEIETLDFICNTFGKFDTLALIELTHDYPEWKRYKNNFIYSIDNGELIIVDDFFENPEVKDSPAIQRYFNGVDPLYMDKERLMDAKECYLENKAMKNAFTTLP
jgi:uncharacterized phage-associated protein